MKTILLISAVAAMHCNTRDQSGVVIGPVIEMRVLNNGARQFCVERQGCFSTLIGSCRVERTPQYDDEVSQSWSVKP